MDAWFTSTRCSIATTLL